MTKILFCDIDGTLTETISGETFKQHSRDVKIIAGADIAIAHFVSRGYKCVGISNQGGVGTGHKSLEDAIAEMQYTLELFPDLETIFFCPDFDGKYCYKVFGNVVTQFSPNSVIKAGAGKFRKPNPGMIELALYLKASNNKHCLMVGDRSEDERCAFNAGVNFIPADVWRNQFSLV